jgi:hypothetical protein
LVSIRRLVASLSPIAYVAGLLFISIVASLSPIAYVAGLLFISTAVLAQNSGTGDIQSEITAVEGKIILNKHNWNI